MNKKILFSILGIIVAIAGVAALSAYEAHIINVTAHIENALSVDTTPIEFGTVFPQEKLYKNLNISLSGSFIEEDRVDDVNYVIKQKPKPRLPENSEYCHQSWDIAWEDFIDCFMGCLYSGGSEGVCWEQCKDIIFEYADPETCYPPLCIWLSKTPDGIPEPGNDTGVSAVHDPSELALGRLAKSEKDIEDNWTIDLVVPCFQGMCAQDYTWEEFGPPVPPELEGETWGCDLWIEVTGISRNEGGNNGGYEGVCGNGILDLGEQCDDGNTTSGDGCDSYCQIESPGPTCTDADHDGYSTEGGQCGPVDCNDAYADIHPGATDICDDGIDQDCSGSDATCSAPTPSLFEYYNAGDDTGTGFFGSYWEGQTFTPPTAHKIKSVKLKLSKRGSPGDLFVKIRATDGAGKPTGPDLASGSIDSSLITTDLVGAWYEISLGAGANLSAGTKYAIVFSTTGGNWPFNTLFIFYDSTLPTYTGGNRVESDDGGVTWGLQGMNDIMFEEWGI